MNLRIEAQQNLDQIDYLKYLIDTIPGYLAEGNKLAFDHAVRNLNPTGSIVEIGSHYGLSTNFIVHLLRHYRAPNPFFNVDPWDRIFEIPAPVDAMGESVPIVGVPLKRRELYKLKTRFFSSGRLPHSYHGYSQEFFEAWKENRTITDMFDRSITLGGSIAFAYIDGNHDYEETLRDFHMVDAFLQEDGFILFDDSGGEKFIEGPNRVAKEVLNRGDYELVFEAPNYFLRKHTCSWKPTLPSGVDSSDKAIEIVNDLVQASNHSKRPILVYGAGEHTAWLMKDSELLNAELPVFFDSNESIQNTRRWARDILPPADITRFRPGPILISSKAYEAEIYLQLKQLEEKGYTLVTLYS